jgi:CDP-diacylglycerol pyrophosphatase
MSAATWFCVRRCWMTRSSPRRERSPELDPFLQSPGVPNYFDAAWRARTFLKGADGQAPERDEIALVANSAAVRGQHQLDIHVGCLLPYARRTLTAAAPKIPMDEWAQIGPVVPHTMFWAYRIAGTDLVNVNQFRLAAEAIAGKAGAWATRGRGRRGSRRQRR